jgi:hypothetical protein
MTLRVDARTFHTSVSVGLVSFPEDGTSLESLMASVDAAMYESKRRGKNQIVGYVSRAEPGSPEASGHSSPSDTPATGSSDGSPGPPHQPAPSDDAAAPDTPAAPARPAPPRAAATIPLPVPILRAVPGVPRGRRPTLPRRLASAPVPEGRLNAPGIRVTVADVGHGGPPADRRIEYRPVEETGPAADR